MNQNISIVIAGIIGFLGVALGAFGAHGLENNLSPKMMETYQTGVLYHLIHSAILLGLALSGRKKYNCAFCFILSGVILFSFSLYLYSVTTIKILAMITPLGGVSFLIGWSCLILKSIKKNSE